MSRDCCGGLTGSESKDHYAILGLDRDASEKSIKLAYRRLAKESHPDLMQDRGSEALQRAAAVMSAINEAYRVLSNRQLRRQYDAELDGDTGLAPGVGPIVEEPFPAPTAAATARRRSRPSRDVLASIVGVFAKQFRKDLAAVEGFKWSDVTAEGFDWAATAGFWTSRYVVAMRGFSVADLETATKFTNYCNLAIEDHNHPLKQTFFLFFLAFQNTNDGPAVAALLRRFCANADGQRTPGPACIAFTDVVRQKTLLCGVRPGDSRYQQLLSSLGLSR